MQTYRKTHPHRLKTIEPPSVRGREAAQPLEASDHITKSKAPSEGEWSFYGETRKAILAHTGAHPT
jgi:hypothetical protein